jgi:hypothetical protein
MGDNEHHSADTNITGNPAIWRRVAFENDYGDNFCDWDVGSYLDMYSDGHVEVWNTHLADNRTDDVNFFIELWFIENGNRINPNEFVFMVFEGMSSGGHKEDIMVVFPPRPDLVGFQANGRTLSCYRHAYTVDPDNNNTLPSPAIVIRPS